MDDQEYQKVLEDSAREAKKLRQQQGKFFLDLSTECI